MTKYSLILCEVIKVLDTVGSYSQYNYLSHPNKVWEKIMDIVLLHISTLLHRRTAFTYVGSGFHHGYWLSSLQPKPHRQSRLSQRCCFYHVSIYNKTEKGNFLQHFQEQTQKPPFLISCFSFCLFCLISS